MGADRARGIKQVIQNEDSAIHLLFAGMDYCMVSLTLTNWIVIYRAIELGTNKWGLGKNCSMSSGAQGLTIY